MHLDDYCLYGVEPGQLSASWRAPVFDVRRCHGSSELAAHRGEREVMRGE